MEKGKLKITMDKDLIEYVKIIARENRTTVSELLNQLIFNFKRTWEHNETENIMADSDLNTRLMETIKQLQTGQIKWYSYEEIF